MLDKIKKIWNIVSTVIVFVVVLCAVFLLGSRLIGYSVYTVLSGSMEPQYSPGDLIYVKAVEPQDVKVGDPITFVKNADGVVATHRVISINEEKQLFYTKGDANQTEDAPVHFNNLIGVPQFSIPLLGYVSSYIQSPGGMLVTIAVGILLIAIVFLPDIIFKEKEENGAAETVTSPKRKLTAQGSGLSDGSISENDSNSDAGNFASDENQADDPDVPMSDE